MGEDWALAPSPNHPNPQNLDRIVLPAKFQHIARFCPHQSAAERGGEADQSLGGIGLVIADHAEAAGLATQAEADCCSDFNGLAVRLRRQLRSDFAGLPLAQVALGGLDFGLVDQLL